MTPAIRVLVLTEDTGKQATQTIQQLTRAAFTLLAPSHDSRLLALSPLTENESALRACQGNRWKERKSPPEVRRLWGHIASTLCQPNSVVVFHVDSDTTWSERTRSENRSKFETMVRARVKAVLCGAEPHPIAPRPVQYLTPEQADEAMRRLLSMHPCYSIESWLYQASREVEALCLETHEHAHRFEIRSWGVDRTLLEEVLRPKDEFKCVGDQHNFELAQQFPAAEVRAAQRSWSEFVEALQRSGSVDALTS